MNNKKQTSSIAIRLATLMERERIESLPRNYELLYDVYSGTNPDLTREYVALGEIKTQKALDELGRKYLPHQHEEGVLAHANEVMQSQMSSFLQLIQEESASLAEFEKVVGETTRAIASDKELDRAAIAESMEKLTKATALQFKTNKSLGETAVAQNDAISELKKEMDALETQKWMDPVTGLANRRSFNKKMVGVFANPERPLPSGLIFAELDGFRKYAATGNARFSNQYLQDVAAVFNANNTSGHFVAYLDKGRFAFVLPSEDNERIAQFVEKLRAAIDAKRPRVVKNDGASAQATLSFGIAMASGADNARTLIEQGSMALSESLKAGGDKVTFFSTGELVGDRKNWALYANG